MARSRPTAKFKSYTHQSRAQFSGTNNNGSRVDNALYTMAQQAHDLLVTNAGTFTAPVPTTANFQTDITNFKTALLNRGVKSIKGSMAQTTLLNQYRRLLMTDLKDLSGYVQTVSRNLANPAINQMATILSGGFPVKLKGINNVPLHAVNVTRQRNKIIQAPSNLHQIIVPTGTGGTYRLRWKKVKGAKAYEINQIVGVNPAAFVASVTSTMYNGVAVPGAKSRFYVVAIMQNNIRSGNSQILDVTAQP